MKNHHRLTAADKDEMSADEFAFASQRKEPVIDANHVRNAMARFDQVKDVTDEERDQAWRRIQVASKKYGVTIAEGRWREISHGGKPTQRP